MNNESSIFSMQKKIRLRLEFFDTQHSNVDAPAVRKSRKYLLGSTIGSLSLLRAPLTPNGMKINYFVNSCVTLAVTKPSL